MYAWGLHREGQAQSTTHLLTDQADGPATVASSQEALQRQLPATLAALAQGPQGLGFTVLHDIPELQTDVAKGIARGLPLGQAPAAQRQHTRWVRELLESTTDHRLDLTGSFCPPEASGCRHQLDDGTLLYTDDNHISAQGALALQHLLAPRLRAAAGAPG
jgi:hypothetical protein